MMASFEPFIEVIIKNKPWKKGPTTLAMSHGAFEFSPLENLNRGSIFAATIPPVPVWGAKELLHEIELVASFRHPDLVPLVKPMVKGMFMDVNCEWATNYFC